MVSFSALEAKKEQLIRKATRGIAAVAPRSAAFIDVLTEFTGTPAAITFKALTDYEDFGNLTTDGIQMPRDVSQSAVNSWGRNTPSRTDITNDTTTITLVPQETKLWTIAIASGADPAGFVPAADTGELKIIKPVSPSPRSYRLLALFHDLSPTGKDIVIGRSFPSAKVTSFAQQNYAQGDEAVTWGVTFTAEVDSVVGSSEVWLFAGAGWNELLEDMGFDVTP